MADFENLTFCISLRLSQMCTCFARTNYRVLYVLGKHLIPHRHPFSYSFHYPQFVAMGLTSLAICEQILPINITKIMTMTIMNNNECNNENDADNDDNDN